MSDSFTEAILEVLTRPGHRPLKAKALAKALRVKKQLLPEFLEALERLIAEGRVHQNPKGLLRAKAGPGLIAGIIRRTASGAGYVIPHEPLAGGPPGDIYIAPDHVGDAHTGDEVLVSLLARRRSGGQRCGRVTEVIERATSTFVGTYFERAGQGYVRIDGTAFGEPIYVGDPGAKGARPNDKVVVEMLRFPTHQRAGEAVLTKVLGPRGEPNVDTLSIIYQFGLPDEFPEDVLEESRLQADRFDDTHLDGRLDLTHETVITIDPPDARDFDDAISLTRSPDGHWHLGVHIADVAHFVRPGSRLDAEAQLRGNSVYLPGRVLPMLPEVISNGLASLQQGKVRFTKSVLMEFTPEGIPLGARFANSAVKVTRRFTYEEVLPIIQDPERQRARVSAHVRVLLVRMHELAMILRGRRFAAGALDLNLPEIELEFDPDGRVTGARELPHDESHQIIEEFMLAANFAVAQTLTNRGVSFLRRVHAEPNFIKLRTFARFVEALGFPLKNFQSRRELQDLLIRVRGQPAEHAVNYALLRSMKQAEYTGFEMGHYALAVDDYCHFTSPIRRYPDLQVHRLMDQLIAGVSRPHGPNEVELARLGKHCSLTERRAERAERELIKVRLLRYMAERIGDELEAVITGVEHYGFFCRGVDLPVEGFVHVSLLSSDDYYDYDADAISLVPRRRGRTYRLGDRVRVQVTHVDVDRRELDFRPVADRGFSRKRERPARRDGSRRGRES